MRLYRRNDDASLCFGSFEHKVGYDDGKIFGFGVVGEWHFECGAQVEEVALAVLDGCARDDPSDFGDEKIGTKVACIFVAEMMAFIEYDATPFDLM